MENMPYEEIALCITVRERERERERRETGERKWGENFYVTA
jgi:hypothetical protein